MDAVFRFNSPRYPWKELLDSTNEVTLLFEENYQLEYTKELFRVNLNLLILGNLVNYQVFLFTEKI